MSAPTVTRNKYIATDGYRAWLNGGAIATPTALSKVAALMRRDNKGGVDTKSDGKGRFRSSLIGGCERKQALSYLGVEQNDADITAAVLGTWGHYRWQVAGLSQGFLKRIEILTARRIKGIRFGGRADGILSDGSLLEVKTVNNFTFKTVKEAPTQAHKMQVNLYLHLLGMGVASVVYEDRAFGEQKEHEVVYDYDLYQYTVERSVTIRDWTVAGLLPRMHPECTQGSWMRKSCSFREVCLSRWVSDETVPD